MAEGEDTGGITAEDLSEDDPIAETQDPPADIPEIRASDFQDIDLGEEVIEEDPTKVADVATDADDAPATEIAKQLKALHPDIFKQIPGLRKALFAGPQVLEVFNTPEEARNAYKRLEQMDHVVEQTLQGNVGSFLDKIHEAEPSSVKVFVDNFLPTVYEKSPELFKSAVAPIFASMLNSMLANAHQNQNKALYLSAQNASQFIFGTQEPPKFDNGRQRVNQPDPEKEKLAAENKELNDVLSKNFVSGIRAVTDKTLEAEIGQRLDPKNAIPLGLRKMVIKQAMDDVKEKLGSDKNHIARLMMIRQRAANSGYSDNYKQTMIAAYMSSARAVIPGIVQGVRANIAAKQGKAPAARPAIERDRDRAGRFAEGRVDSKDVAWDKYKNDKDFLFGEKVAVKQ